MPGAANYREFFSSEADVRVLGTTFYIATISTIVCVLIGYPYAYLMTIVAPRVTGLLLIFVLVPFWSSLLVRTFAWEVLLRDTGIVNGLLLSWGLIDQPLTLMRNTLGVILGMSQILLPFMVLPLFTVMRRIDPELTRAAANLGHRRSPRSGGSSCRSACRASWLGRCWCSCSPSASTSPPRSSAAPARP